MLRLGGAPRGGANRPSLAHRQLGLLAGVPGEHLRHARPGHTLVVERKVGHAAPRHRGLERDHPRQPPTGRRGDERASSPRARDTPRVRQNNGASTSPSARPCTNSTDRHRESNVGSAAGWDGSQPTRLTTRRAERSGRVRAWSSRSATAAAVATTQLDIPRLSRVPRQWFGVGAPTGSTTMSQEASAAGARPVAPSHPTELVAPRSPRFRRPDGLPPWPVMFVLEGVGGRSTRRGAIPANMSAQAMSTPETHSRPAPVSAR